MSPRTGRFGRSCLRPEGTQPLGSCTLCLEFGVLLKEGGSRVGQDSEAQSWEQPENIAAWGERRGV